LNFEVTGFFYNPNIHPFQEYCRRKVGVEKISQAYGLEVIYPEYNPGEYLDFIKDALESPKRCSLCWQLRLLKTATTVRKMNFDTFTTTLLVSPYQDQKLLQSIGERAAREEGLSFHFEDFRPGFREAHEKAKKQDIYCQKYCGCEYSENERVNKKVR
jgi:predicted adenine nucleotide alpha hydrolase (AANH) superfamily ATPase